MLRSMACVHVLLYGFVLNAEEIERPADTPAAKFQSLVEEFDEAGGSSAFAPRFLQFAEQHASDPAAVNALMWVLKNRRTRPEAGLALSLLAKDHLKSEHLGPACERIAKTPAMQSESLLRSIVEQNPHQQVRARACLALAALLEDQIKVVDQLHENPQLADRVIQYYGGGEYGRFLANADRAAIEKKLVKSYEQMLSAFADHSIEDQPLKVTAETALFRIRHLTVGRVAPEIEGEDIFGNPFKLSDYRGKVIVLSFWGHW